MRRCIDDEVLHMTPSAQHDQMSSSDWQPVAGLAGVWEIRRMHGAIPLRGVAVALGDDRVCIYSPVPRAGDAAMNQLRAMGRPIFLAPNAYHTLGLPEHAAAFDEAPIIASDSAYQRIKRKTKLSVEDPRLLEAHLPSHVSLLQPPDLRNGEVWLSVRDSNRCAWIVCDGFLNLPRLPGNAMGLVLRLLRMGPGLSISVTFKFLLAKDRRAYRDWLLAKIAEDRPTMLIPSHGQVIDDDQLPDRLERLVRQRF
jgi:hypothetical protein